MMAFRAIVGAVAVAGLGGHEPRYLLISRFKRGEQHHYAIATTVSRLTNDNRAIQLEFGMTFKVLKLKDGAATIHLSYDQPQSGGHPLALTLAPSDIVLNKFNKPSAQSHSAQIFPCFSGKPSLIGDKWTGQSPLTLSPSGGAMVETVYKLDGVKTEKGRRIAVLSLKMRGLAQGEGTALVDVADGSLLSSVVNVTARGKDATAFPVQMLIKRVS